MRRTKGSGIHIVLLEKAKDRKRAKTTNMVLFQRFLMSLNLYANALPLPSFQPFSFEEWKKARADQEVEWTSKGDELPKMLS